MLSKVKTFKIYIWVNVAIVLFAILTPVIYVRYFDLYVVQQNRSFWDSVIGNLIATIVALVGGIPVGLWIDRYIKRGEELSRVESDRRHELKILGLLKKELEYSFNNIFLPSRKGASANSVQLIPYKTDLWDAFCSSEEIKYIETPELLDEIASAYYIIKTAKYFETEAYHIFHSRGLPWATSILQHARNLDPRFEEMVDLALKEISKCIKDLEKN